MNSPVPSPTHGVAQDRDPAMHIVRHGPETHHGVPYLLIAFLPRYDHPVTRTDTDGPPPWWKVSHDKNLGHLKRASFIISPYYGRSSGFRSRSSQE